VFLGLRLVPTRRFKTTKFSLLHYRPIGGFVAGGSRGDLLAKSHVTMRRNLIHLKIPLPGFRYSIAVAHPENVQHDARAICELLTALIDAEVAKICAYILERDEHLSGVYTYGPTLLRVIAEAIRTGRYADTPTQTPSDQSPPQSNGAKQTG